MKDVNERLVGRLNQNNGAGENASVGEIKKIKYQNENQVNDAGVIKHGSKANKSKTKILKQEDFMKLQIEERTKEKNETNTNGYVQNKSVGKSVSAYENNDPKDTENLSNPKDTLDTKDPKDLNYESKSNTKQNDQHVMQKSDANKNKMKDMKQRGESKYKNKTYADIFKKKKQPCSYQKQQMLSDIEK